MIGRMQIEFLVACVFPICSWPFLLPTQESFSVDTHVFKIHLSNSRTYETKFISDRLMVSFGHKPIPMSNMLLVKPEIVKPRRVPFSRRGVRKYFDLTANVIFLSIYFNAPGNYGVINQMFFNVVQRKQ